MVPTWLWSPGAVVVVVVVVEPFGLVWVCDMVELLLGVVVDWSCELVVCAPATPRARSNVAAVIPNVFISIPPIAGVQRIHEVAQTRLLGRLMAAPRRGDGRELRVAAFL